MITQTDVTKEVREFILQSVFTDKDKVKDDTLIFKNGFFDSMGMVTLITFLEEKFSVQTSDEDLVEENFESINAISNYVIRKTA
jgi:acyl carrier protein